MPRVPTYQSTETQRSLPNVNLQTTANTDAFGGGQAKALGAVGKGLGDMGNAFEQIQDREDTQAARDAYLRYSDKVRGYLHDPDQGLYAKQGANAKGISESSGAEFDRFAGEASEGLTRKQIEKFNQLSFGLRKNSMDGIARHESQQFRAQENATDDAMMSDAVNGAVAAYTDPNVVGMFYDQGLEAVKAKAARNGAGPEVTHAAVEKYNTQFHAAMIGKIMVDSPTGARAYYDANKDEISGQVQTKLEASIQAGEVKQESQAATDDIIAQGLGITASLDAARSKYQDKPEVRDEVVSRIKARFNEKNIAEKEAADEAWKIVRRDKSTDNIPPEILNALPANVFVSMDKAASTLREGKEPTHNPEEWYKFNQLVQRATMGDEKAIKEIRTMHVHEKLYKHLDEEHYDKAIAIQNGFIKSNTAEIKKSAVASGSVITTKAAADAQLNILFSKKKNSDRSKDQNKFANEFHSLLQVELEQWSKDNNNKKVPASERDRIIRELTTTLTKEGTLWDSTYELDEIPAEHLSSIADSLRKNNKPVNGKNIIAAYLAAKEAGLVE